MFEWELLSITEIKMNQTQESTSAFSLDEFIERFEDALFSEGQISIQEYLPEEDNPIYEEVLVELIRIELEYGWEHGTPTSLDNYQEQFPDFFSSDENRLAVAYEEFRLKQQAGEAPNWEDYQKKYQLLPLKEEYEQREQSWLKAAARSYKMQSRNPNATNHVSASQLIGKKAAMTQFFSHLHHQSPQTAQRFADGVLHMPEVGQCYFGFELKEELGRGTFGRVFLAEQSILAHRPVALKVAPNVGGESQALARLQHTHIMPIYSVHREGPLQAVCMPYYGAVTLADILREVKSRPSLPISRKEVFSTVQGMSTREDNESPFVRPTPTEPELPKKSEELSPVEGMSYSETILWIGGCLADGLAHAHERGILHRDIKPANILLSDEGQPMLLDFNLAEDIALSQNSAAATLGGTLPYMSPEHVQAFQGKSRPIDARSDIYSLGLVLYELLTGITTAELLPQSSSEGFVSVDQLIDRTVKIRSKPVKPIREVNPNVSPAMASIVEHCLHIDPDQRYQSAKHLKEDIDRQLESQPLLYAPEPSWKERIQKKLRRSPKLLRRLAISALALMGVLAIWLAISLSESRHQEQLRRSQDYAQAQKNAFDIEFRQAQFLLSTQHDVEEVQQGEKLAQRALQRFQVLESSDWHQQAPFLYLDSSSQAQIKKKVKTLLWTMPDATNHDEMKQLGADNAEELILLAQRATVRKEYRQALPMLQKAVRLDPKNYWAYFLIGICQDNFGKDQESISAYSICIALDPTFYGAYFNRGLAFLRHREYASALKDFNQVLKEKPELSEAYINRSLAWQGLRKYQEAIEDLNQALKFGASERVYFMRSRAKRRAGDKEGASKDFQEGLKRQPSDEQSWVARGLARAKSEPEQALKDFEQALKLNPASRSALTNRAYVFAEILKKPAEAILELDRVHKLYPSHASAVSSRGVLYGRLNQREQALKDAQLALQIDQSPALLYQVGCIYALTSQTHAQDAERAIHLLSRALSQDYGADLLKIDPDLKPLRSRPDFRRLLAAADTLLRSRNARLLSQQ